MNKRILISTIFIVSLLLAGCQESIDDAKADFCTDLGTFAQALAEFRAIDATSTTDDLNNAVSDVENAWNDLKSSASNLEDIQVDDAQGAFQTLKDDISNISGDSSLADAEVQIKQDVVAALSEVVDIFTTSCTYGQTD